MPPSAKEVVRAMLASLPDDVSLEDIQYHIYVRQKVEQGRLDLKHGRTVTQEEAERIFAPCLRPGS